METRALFACAAAIVRPLILKAISVAASTPIALIRRDKIGPICATLPFLELPPKFFAAPAPETIGRAAKTVFDAAFAALGA